MMQLVDLQAPNFVGPLRPNPESGPLAVQNLNNQLWISFLMSVLRIP